MITIDHKVYPHIVDRILLYSSRRLRRAFRATSVSFRDQVNARSAEHLVYSDDVKTKDGIMVFRNDARHREYNEQALQHARVADVYANSDDRRPVNLGLIGLQQPVLNVLRVYDKVDHVPESHTTICFDDCSFNVSRVMEKVVLHRNLRKLSGTLTSSGQYTIEDLVVICPTTETDEETIVQLIKDIVSVIEHIAVHRIIVVEMVSRKYFSSDEDFHNEKVGYEHALFGLAELQLADWYERGITNTWDKKRIDDLEWWFQTEEDYAAGLSEEERRLTFDLSDNDSEGDEDCDPPAKRA